VYSAITLARIACFHAQLGCGWYLGESIVICLRSRSFEVVKAQRAQIDVSQSQLELLLDHISLPIYLVNRERFLVYANAAGHEQLSKSCFTHLLTGRLQILGDADQETRFEDAVHAATEHWTLTADRTTTMTLGEPRTAKASITIMPFSEMDPCEYLAVVILTAQDDCETQTTLRLQQSLDLTPSEARVAYHISAGRRPKHIAEHLEVSINTVRSHLANVFFKAGCNDQAAFCVLAKHLLTPVRTALSAAS
jgi:DNA-binding CsgD family transcriptional regulator